ncbi:MAG TPA: DUF1731 domain-containing protein [Microbacteriaceae bacterium]|nr:DUF1731 domain-containing protein [Microbacteriaceae bacterium]
MSRVVVGGASGFLGRRLCEDFRDEGLEVVTVGRSADSDVRWEDAAGLRAAVDGAELVVGLAGKSVNCRYTARNRAALLESRISTTRALREAIAAATAPPPLWLNASTATIYRHADDRAQTESSGELGTELFSEDLARAWEAELGAGKLPGTRRVALQITIVLGDGGALGPLARLSRLGLGGANHDGWWFPLPGRRAARTWLRPRTRGGAQRFSWVHVDDVSGIVRHIRAHAEIVGPVILGTPTATDNHAFMATLRRAVGARFGVPTPRWMLELGSFAMRTEAELVLKSRWVAPEVLLRTGYHFQFTDLEEAIRASLTR